MRAFTKRLLLSAAAVAAATQAWAADLPEPYVEPQPPEAVYEPVATGGWYIRGDVDYHQLELRGKPEYVLYGEPGGKGKFDEAELDSAWSLGGGVGYHVTDYLRTDLTADYFFDSDFTGSTNGFAPPDFTRPVSSTDTTSVSTWLLLANAYWDFYHYNGFTFYGGAGIGGAHVKWDKLNNDIEGEVTEHEGGKDWRFAYALMAGASYCLSKNVELDLGYRYAHVEGGEMFGYKNGGGPGYDDGFNVHEGRAGLRYSFGGGSTACAPEVAAYEPPAEPVYK